jgi:hypothetical protein
LFDIVLKIMTNNFNLVNMSEHAEIIFKKQNLPRKKAA